jgi:hypothetical protein
MLSAYLNSVYFSVVKFPVVILPNIVSKYMGEWYANTTKIPSPPLQISEISDEIVTFKH